MRQECPLLPFLFNIILKVLTNPVRKVSKMYIDQEGRYKTVLVCRQTCLHRKSKRIKKKKILWNLEAIIARLQDTQLIYKCQLFFYIPTMNKQNLKLKTHCLFIFSGGSDKRPGFDPWIGKIPWRREGMAIHSSILAWRIPMDRGSWWATVHGVAKSWT